MSAGAVSPPVPINGRTMVVGLLGWPVAHSLSPAMHNAAAAALGLDLVYVPLPAAPERLRDALVGLPALGLRGANVTVPHKEAALPFLDGLDPAAKAIGAVNTIVVSDGRLLGHNTDADGFGDDLAAKGIDLAGRHAAVLGAGGAARAVVYALRRAGARVTVVARRPAQAAALAADVGDGLTTVLPWPELGALGPVDLLLNTTPLGMSPQTEASPWPDDLAWPGRPIVLDLVYRPAETLLLRRARAAGLRGENGLGMLLRQGARSFFLWTGREPSLEVMAQVLGQG